MSYVSVLTVVYVLHTARHYRAVVYIGMLDIIHICIMWSMCRYLG
jgi:hypothetical protein